MGGGRNQTYQKTGVASVRGSTRARELMRVLSPLLLPLLILPLPQPAPAQTAQDIFSQAGQAITQAYETAQKKEWQALKPLVLQAATDPLTGAYPQYWYLREQLRDEAITVPAAVLQAFIEQHHEDAYLVDRLKGEWLVAAVRRGDYPRARALEPVLHRNPAIACARLLIRHEARHKTNEKIKAEQALQTWASDDMCWQMLEILLQDQVVTWAALHGQLRNLLERNRSQDARRMAELLFTERQMLDYTALMKNPRQWLKGKKKPGNRAQRALTTLALARLAHNSSSPNSRSPSPNPNARLVNAMYFEKQWAARLPEADRQWVWGQFALAAVLDGEPQAARWYRYSERPGKAVKTEFNHAWQVRAELRQPKIDWKRVDAVIKQMKPEQRQQTAWQYWRARALNGQKPV